MNITKKDIQDKLIEIGASPVLVRMPSVIERLYMFGVNICKLKVDLYGNIIYGNHRFTKNEDDTAIYEYVGNELETVYIDKYGMDKSTLNNNVYRENGKIIEKSDDVVSEYNDELEDDGGWSLDSFKINNYKVFNYQFTDEKLAYIISNYPQTERWYVENGFLPQDNIKRKEKIISSINLLIEKLKLDEQMNEEDEYFQNDRIIWLKVKKESNQEEVERQKSLECEILHLEEVKKCYENNTRPLLEYTQLQAEINRAQFYKKELELLKVKSLNKLNKISILKEFAIEKCSPIPIVGKNILKEVTKIDTKIEGLNIEKDCLPDTELGDVYKSYLMEENKLLQYTSILYELRDYIVRKCAKIPVIGKKVLAEMSILARTKQTPGPYEKEE